MWNSTLPSPRRLQIIRKQADSVVALCSVSSLVIGVSRDQTVGVWQPLSPEPQQNVPSEPQQSEGESSQKPSQHEPQPPSAK